MLFANYVTIIITGVILYVLLNKIICPFLRTGAIVYHQTNSYAAPVTESPRVDGLFCRLDAPAEEPGSLPPTHTKEKSRPQTPPLFCGGDDAVLKKKENIGKYVVKAVRFPV